MQEPQYIKIDERGNKFYYKDKEMTTLHRTDGPAIEYASGDKSWYVNGERHRLDGPAIEYADGDKQWYVNGKCHRTDGPAAEFGGNKTWYVNDKLHRLDGPAIEFANGHKEWYIKGKKLTKEEFNRRTKETVLTMDEIARKFNVDVSNLKIAK